MHGKRKENFFFDFNFLRHVFSMRNMIRFLSLWRKQNFFDKYYHLLYYFVIKYNWIFCFNNRNFYLLIKMHHGVWVWSTYASSLCENKISQFAYANNKTVSRRKIQILKDTREIRAVRRIFANNLCLLSNNNNLFMFYVIV